jgi:hypothetical protein
MAEPKKEKLPPKTEDQVVEVSLKHVALAFATVLGSTVLVGSTIIAVRDYSRYKRQQAMVDSLKELFITLENTIWKERKTAGS